MLLPFRPELEGVDDAHVQQPPRQTRPAATRFATRWRRGVLPAAGDLESGEKRAGQDTPGWGIESEQHSAAKKREINVSKPATAAPVSRLANAWLARLHSLTVAVRGRSPGGAARMGPSNDRRSLQWGWGCCGRQGNVIRRPSCPCIRCCRGGPLRERAVERESPRDRRRGRSSGAGATSTATVLSRQETPTNRHSTREARRPSECSSEAGPAVARVSCCTRDTA
jgi:hypothetical protein